MTDSLALSAVAITVTPELITGLLPGVNMKLVDIPGWYGGPGVRRDSTPRLWTHGQFSERGWREARLVTLQGAVVCDTRAQAAAVLDSVASVLADGTEGLLTVNDPDIGPRWAKVLLAGSPKTMWNGTDTVEFSLDLLAADPRKYGTSTSAATAIAAPGGGLVYPLGSPAPPGVLDYGATGTPGTVALANKGSADTAPVFTVTGDLPNGFTITNVETGRRLVYASAILAGQYLRLDTADGSVKLEGYADRSALLTVRQWTRLSPYSTGTWLFEAQGSTGALLSVEVKPAWW